MDRNTIIAIVLSAIVIIVGTTIQATLFAPDMTEQTTAVTEEIIASEEIAVATSSAAQAYGKTFTAYGEDPSTTPFTVENEVLSIVFDPVGATVDDIKLTQHLTEGQPSSFLFKDSDDVNPFMLYVGDDRTNPVDAVFDYEIKELSMGITQVTFSRDFITDDGDIFTIRKIFAVPDNDEYMIQLVVSITGKDGAVIPFNYDGSSYSINFGPQVGPEFKNMSSSYDYRRVNVLREDKSGKDTVKYDKSNNYVSDPSKPLDWMSLTGKYFVAIAIPETEGTVKEFSSTYRTYDSGVSQENYMYITRIAANSGEIDDLYSFYLGPQNAHDLALYDRAQDNIFGLENHRLKKAMESSWLSWLETVLKWCLVMIYKVIPNYGVSIIILTILIKLALHPISKKGMESTAKMSALSPKIEEIKRKFPDDPQQQNLAMSKLYKEEGINPMGSCIPMLIQFPILIAFYGLLNKNIELRGAMFIPGWIPDLSIPETVATLPFNIPLLGNQVHLLPILYTFSMILSMKITQQSTTSASGQEGMMKFMTYGMPIIFFFILYNAPSGLLVYWSVMNLISIGSQIYVNKKKKGQFVLEIQKKDEAKAESKKKKKRR